MASYEEAMTRSALYQLLSLAFLYPEEGATAHVAELFTGMLPALMLGMKDSESALEGVAHAFGTCTDVERMNEYTAVFGHGVSKDCPPYEGEYDQAHVFQKTRTLADLATFYQAFGVAPNPDLKERPDHVSVEMEFMHVLTTKEDYALFHDHGRDKVQLCRRAEKAFLANHLANWITTFARRVGQKAGSGSVYQHLAGLLEVHMNAEFRSFRLEASPDGEGVQADVEESDLDCQGCPVALNTRGGSGLL